MAPANGQLTVEHPGMVLEIVHGRTQFRERPVTSARFLIGSGEACDLRLNSQDIPPLHSLLLHENGQAIVEAVAQAPSLFVNGKAVREAFLHDGDLIRIGQFELRARYSSPPPQSGAVRVDQAHTDDLASLSASDLIDRLEHDTNLVADSIRKRQLGFEALISAAASRRPAAETLQGPHFTRASARTSDSPELLSRDLENLSRVLDELSRQLDRQQEHASQRESSYASATEELQESHNRLAEQVEWLSSQIAELQSRLPLTRPRAIA